MLVNLPILEKTFDEETKEVKTTKSFLPVNIDTSFTAHLKWEEQFQSVMNCDLTTYTERVVSWMNDKDESKSKAKAHFLGLLKLLYCYINSDKLPTFKSFCGLFDYAIADEILSKITIILEEVGKSASKN